MKSEMSKGAELVLAWLASRRDRGGSPSELKEALASFGAHLPDWTAQVSDAIAALESGGLVAREGKRIRLTDAGGKRALAVLGVKALPARVDWGKIKRDYLVPRMMGLPTSAAGMPADSLCAAVIAHHRGLTVTSETPTLAQVENALVWKALGVDSDRPLTKKALLTQVLAFALEGARVREPKKALALLAAKHVGARRAGAEAVRDAIARRWIDGKPAPVATTPLPSPPAAEDLPAFAARVIQAAKGAKTGRFGDHKVFIGQVHRELGSAVPDLDSFKARLVEAHRAELLTLSRADLVEAMSPEDVRVSETRYLGEEFHFVRIPEDQERW